MARDAASGAMVGGANLIAFPLRRDDEVLSINLNYVFIASDAAPARPLQAARRRHRRRGGELLRACRRARSPRLIFIEQNDPVQMSRADYARDTQHSGIDQMARIRLWTALGAKIIDFPYVQPPLSAGQAPDDTLIYAVLGADGDALDACLLHAHLLRFFGISVLKGERSARRRHRRAPARRAGGALPPRHGAIPLLTAAGLPSLMQEAPGSGRSNIARELIRTMA